MAVCWKQYWSPMSEKYPYFKDKVLKEEQQRVVHAILSKQHVLVNLPTGFGKSLCYVIPPLIADEIDPAADKHVALVISPLITIIEEQTEKLTQTGISAFGVHTGSSQKALQEIKKGNAQIFMTPECAVKDTWKAVLATVYGERICLWAIDECHCVSKWGLTFRKDYRRLVELTSDINAPCLFLTATATKAIEDDLMELFNINDHIVVATVPDRPDLFIDVRRTQRSTKELEWVIEHLCVKGVHSKKIMVFTSSIDYTKALYFWALDKLDEKGCAYIGERGLVTNRIVDMYHAHVDSASDTRVREMFEKPDSTIRLLFSTIKLGMGVDIRDVDIVIIFGVPQTLVELWQEVGRCARDGRKGLVVIYGTNWSLVRCQDPLLKALFENSVVCSRHHILSAFVLSGMDRSVPHKAQCKEQCQLICECDRCSCCSLCALQCTCKNAKVDPINSYLQN